MPGPHGAGEPVTFEVVEVGQPAKSTGGSEFMGYGRDAKGNMFNFRGRFGSRGSVLQTLPKAGDVLRGRLELGKTGPDGYPLIINVEPAEKFN